MYKIYMYRHTCTYNTHTTSTSRHRHTTLSYIIACVSNWDVKGNTGAKDIQSMLYRMKCWHSCSLLCTQRVMTNTDQHNVYIHIVFHSWLSHTRTRPRILTHTPTSTHTDAHALTHPRWQRLHECVNHIRWYSFSAREQIKFKPEQ